MTIARRTSLAALVLVCVLTGLAVRVHGDEAPADALQNQIDQKNEEIKKLEAQANQYQATLQGIGKQANTLQSQIQTIDQTIKKLATNVQLTNTKISRANLEIQELGIGIASTSNAIDIERGHLASFVSMLASSDRETPLEILMKNETVSAFFTSIDSLVHIEESIQGLLGQLRKNREDLQTRKTATEQKKQELKTLASQLADQKALQEYERRERATLLAETKNQEQRYQSLLADVQKKRDALQQEINSLEAGLSSNFDRSLVPKAGSGILGWPLADPVFITQYFGNTDFARSGAYSGKGHNGIDLRAANGTPVFASDQGIVRATGDTDLACRRASYGRWILIDHPNGLSTLYGHLSLIKVAPGDHVGRGDVIAYSGRTGYATGPHLHFSVFVSQAVSVGQLRSKVCGTIMTLPLSPFSGYLNPMDYL